MTRPRRILMTVDAVGGVWQYATELCAALAPLGFETVLACIGPPPDHARRDALAAIPALKLIDTGLDLDWLAPDAAALDATADAIAALAEAEGADLVHLNQPAFAVARFTMPVVVVVHSCVATWWDAVHGGDAPAGFAWQTERVARGLRRADAIVTPSHAFAAVVRETYDLPATPAVVWNGRTAFPPRDRPTADLAFTAGRLWDRGKNAVCLDRVAARLRHPFHAAGTVRGPNGEAIALHHLEPLGVLDEDALAARLSARPIFVSAALYEPFGLAVLEAAQAGCALVLSDIPTFHELWDGAALFVPPSDDDGFVKAIETLLADRDKRMTAGAAARRRTAEFTPARLADGMVAIYEAAASSGLPARTAA